jgi:hypothetical protein
MHRRPGTEVRSVPYDSGNIRLDLPLQSVLSFSFAGSVLLCGRELPLVYPEPKLSCLYPPVSQLEQIRRNSF